MGSIHYMVEHVLNKAESIKAGFNKINIELSEKQVEQFICYADLLMEWNQKMNLTAITEFDEIVHKHFVDSCSLALFESKKIIKPASKIIDLGTGAGFPGIPLKIIYPEIRLCLADSLNKRITFLKTVVDCLFEDSVELVHGRAEDIGHNKLHREKYDICVSRAVANLSTLCEYCLPLVKKDGYLLSYKSGDIDKELKKAERAIALLGGQTACSEKFTLPGTDYQRSLIYITKAKKTPDKYPRKAGTPSRTPLT